MSDNNRDERPRGFFDWLRGRKKNDEDKVGLESQPNPKPPTVSSLEAAPKGGQPQSKPMATVIQRSSQAATPSPAATPGPTAINAPSPDQAKQPAQRTPIPQQSSSVQKPPETTAPQAAQQRPPPQRGPPRGSSQPSNQRVLDPQSQRRTERQSRSRLLSASSS